MKILLFVIMFLTGTPVFGQEIVKQGNVFIQQDSKSLEVKTEYVYQDKNGNQYPVYLNSKGKAFIKKISQKTGKEYRYYVPEIGKQINPSAYDETISVRKSTNSYKGFRNY